MDPEPHADHGRRPLSATRSEGAGARVRYQPHDPNRSVSGFLIVNSERISTSKDSRGVVLLTGATGYVGGRLLAALERSGVRVRCLARRPEFMRSRNGTSEVVAGDLFDRNSLDGALEGVRAAYYLVHSMGSRGSFEEMDRQAAQNFADACRAAGVERIIYLGGLGNDQEALSPHLRSRHEVGNILRRSGIPVLEFRASIVIGSGSLSFEMIRSLVERLPVMITPKWVAAKAQPIAITDLIEYLMAGLRLPIPKYGIYEIGGADQVSYAEIMRVYARQRGLRRLMVPVPVLTPFLSSLWLGLVTPLYARIGRKLIESIVHATVVSNERSRKTFQVQPMGIDAAVKSALKYEDRAFAETRWSDALSSAGESSSWGGVSFGSRLADSRKLRVNVPGAIAFKPIQQIGGEVGWYAFNWLWRIRGFLDLLVGGVGVRRGRPAPNELRVGDALDFWRVESFEPNRLLRLSAEMRLPGRAWLEFEVEDQGNSATIRQTALFDPSGLWGRVYWYALYPLHQIVFGGMLRAIARAATFSVQGARRNC